MKKIISFASLALFSIMLFGCGDSNNYDDFMKFAKQAVKDDKHFANLYDFKNNKYYSYTNINIAGESSTSIIDMLLNPNVSFKDCSISKEQMNKVALSSDSITFTCTKSLGNNVETKGKVKIIGKNLTENKSIFEMDDINILLNFNNSTYNIKNVIEIQNDEKNKIIEFLKQKCNISNDEKIYEDCVMPSSRIKVVGL